MSLGRIIGARVSSQRELVEALSKSKILETRILDDGACFVRVDGTDFPQLYMQSAAGPVQSAPPIMDPSLAGPPPDSHTMPYIPEAFRMPGVSLPPQQPVRPKPPMMFPPTGGVIPPFMQQGYAQRPPMMSPPQMSPPVMSPPPDADEPGEPPHKRLRPQDIAAESDIDKVCWNYVKGSCMKGNACRWGHIVPQGYTGPSPGVRESWRPPNARGAFGGCSGSSGLPMAFACRRHRKSPGTRRRPTRVHRHLVAHGCALLAWQHVQRLTTALPCVRVLMQAQTAGRFSLRMARSSVSRRRTCG